MLAGPYRPIDELLAYQADWTRMLLEASGLSEEQSNAELATLDKAVAGLQLLRAGTYTGTSIMGVRVAFWHSWLDLGDEAPGLISALNKPIMALSGDHDWYLGRSDAERTAFHRCLPVELKPARNRPRLQCNREAMTDCRLAERRFLQPPAATGGTVAIETIFGQCVSGHYAIDFGQDTLSGTFGAVICTE